MRSNIHTNSHVSSSDGTCACNRGHIQPAVEVQEVGFSFPDREVLRCASFCVPFGHTTMLVGDNGAGKSTLIKLVLGDLSPSCGSISLFDQNPVHFKDWDRVGYVPQFESQGVQGFPATAQEIVASGLSKRQRKSLKSRSQLINTCTEALELCGVSDLASKLISSLSGGQRQRVMLARALVKSPELLVLDEPTSSLDIKASTQFFLLLERLCHESRLAALVVTHDQAQLTCKHAQVVHLEDGFCSIVAPVEGCSC